MADEHIEAGHSNNESQATATTFVGWTPGMDDKPRKSAPRLHHKKSRTGCQQCRSRHVKCNEVHPICGGCERHSSICNWGRPTTSQTKSYEIRPKPSSSNAQAPPSEVKDPEESAERRLLELRLLHQYMAITALSLNVPGDKNIKDWSLRVPKLALKHPSLLYSIYTLAALHLSRVEPDDPSYYHIYQRYLALTLRDHRADVGNLNKENADAVLITSTYLRVCTFAALADREIIPYTAPKEWLSLANTSGYSLAVSVCRILADDENSITRSMLSNAPGLKPSGDVRDDASLFMDSNRQGLEYLLRRTPDNVLTEPWDDVIQEAYKTTLATIGAVKLAIAAKDPRAQILRRLIIFPTVVETAFIKLVNQAQSRALVVLAHYFALLVDFQDIWYIGNIGKREVRGINNALPEEWRDLMPLIPSDST